MISIKKTALASLFALATFSAAQAAPTETFSWNAAFADLGPSNNGLSFTGTFSPQPYSITGAAGYSQPIEDYLRITTSDTNLLGAATDELQVSFNFYKPDTQSSTVTGDGTEVTFFGAFNGGTLVWDNHGVSDVTFADGSELNIALENENYGNILTNTDHFDVDATVTIEKVPEPTSVALFGVGLLGLGMIAMRRRGPNCTAA